jgi:hypothetical protein
VNIIVGIRENHPHPNLVSTGYNGITEQMPD